MTALLLASKIESGPGEGVIMLENVRQETTLMGADDEIGNVSRVIRVLRIQSVSKRKGHWNF